MKPRTLEAWSRMREHLAVSMTWLIVGAGCMSGDGQDGSGLLGRSADVDWLCYEQTPTDPNVPSPLPTRCWCYGLTGGDAASAGGTGIREVAACSPSFNCCFVSENEEGDLDCECENFPTACELQIASRRGAERVRTCPPGSTAFARCAALSENCGEDYLQSQDLVGCCEGLSCAPNADDVPVCQESLP